MSESFDLPFRLGRDGSFTTVQPNSTADLRNRAQAGISWRLGYREDRPDLGIPDPAFKQGGIDLDVIRTAYADVDPGLVTAIERDPLLLDGLVDTINIDPGEGDAP